MTVVFDTNVVVSAIFWPGEARHCFALWCQRRFRLAVTGDMLAEYEEVCERTALEYPQVKPSHWLAWIKEKAIRVEPGPLGKQRSRDREDDKILSCALASGAELIVTRDRDLLTMRKPFGIEIMTPRQFLARLT